MKIAVLVVAIAVAGGTLWAIPRVSEGWRREKIWREWEKWRK